MRDNQTPPVRRAHEVATSVNIAFVLLAFLMISANNPISNFLLGEDRVVSGRLGLTGPHADSSPGYFAFFVPGVVLALCTWCFLRLSAKTPFTREFFRSGAAIAAFVGPQAWWLCLNYANRFWQTAFFDVPIYEVTIFVGGIMYALKSRPIPGRYVSVMLLLHYAFWFAIYGRHLYFMGYGGPIGLTVGLCASLTWLLNKRELEKSNI